MSLKIWEINNLKLELDMEDADVQERYENAFEKLSEEENQIKKDGKMSEFTRSYCNMFVRLYDRIFGEGTSEKIFAGIPISISRYIEIYDSFLEFVKQQTDDVNANIAKKIAKYRPNRQQRRSKKK